MQTGNLKSLKPGKKKPKYWWLKWLNPLSYLPHRLYKDFLSAFFGYQKGIATYYYYHTYPDSYELPLFSAVKIKEISQCSAKTLNLEFESPKKLSRSLDFSSTFVPTKSGLELGYKIKWILLNFKRILQLKTVNIRVLRPPKLRSFLNFDLKNRLTKKLISPEVFKINNFIDSKKALIEIAPYTRTLSLSQLYQIPIEKPPMNKNFISLQLLDKFKQYLSIAAKAKPSEIKLVNAYENMYVEVYKDIKHSPQNNILWCYFDENKIHLKNPKNYYLVFGQRLADQKVFTIVCEG